MTSTEIERHTEHESALTVLPPKQRASSTAIAMLQEHNDLMEMAYSLAVKMCATQFVPQRFRGREKAADATAAMLYGMELGLNPIQSLQRVIPIHGQPTLEARTMVALLQARGYKVKTRDQSDEAVTVWGRDLDGEEYETTWTIERAKKARYVPIPASPDSLCRPEVDDDWVTVKKTWDGKTKTTVVGNMKYITDPQAMLKAKAQAEVCREIAPEVLLGIGYAREDMESEYWGDDDRDWVTTERVTAREFDINDIVGAAARRRGGRSKLAAKVKKAPENPAEEEPQDADVVVEEDSGEPGQDGGNDQSEGAEPSSGATHPSDSGDQEPDPETDYDGDAAALAAEAAEANADTPPPVDPKPEPEPPGEKRVRNKVGEAMERRLFKLLGELKPPLDREDRILVYRGVLERPDITSTNDLTDVEIGKLCDQLFKWSEFGVLNDRIRDIVNTAVIAQENGGDQ